MVRTLEKLQDHTGQNLDGENRFHLDAVATYPGLMIATTRVKLQTFRHMDRSIPPRFS